MSGDFESILVTGGAGFIGSCFVRQWIGDEQTPVVNLDKLTYAGHPASLGPARNDPRHIFVEGDICDRALVSRLLTEHRVGAIVHFAAESHVDRSIDGPPEFVETNVVGTFHMLEAARSYWNGLSEAKQQAFRFLHISTDEVYGTLAADEWFTERNQYAPNSPYASSKAAADHFVRAYWRTFGLPTIITNCSNNYGPYQFPEKLVPLMIRNAHDGRPLPIYGDGQQVRDWLYVDDHVQALRTALAKGQPGEVYLIGARNPQTNWDVVHALCAAVDELCPGLPHAPCTSLITHVEDRPGHDRRYAIDPTKIEQELGWRPQRDFETGLRETVAWYLNNADWIAEVTAEVDTTQRLGLSGKSPGPG